MGKNLMHKFTIGQMDTLTQILYEIGFIKLICVGVKTHLPKIADHSSGAIGAARAHKDGKIKNINCLYNELYLKKHGS